MIISIIWIKVGEIHFYGEKYSFTSRWHDIVPKVITNRHRSIQFRGLLVMKIKVFTAMLFVLPQLASGAVYMCVDQATGKTSFTDKACAVTDAREEVKIDATNFDSGRKSKTSAREKTWRSEEDTRKSGREYNASRRNLYDNSATAAADN